MSTPSRRRPLGSLRLGCLCVGLACLLVGCAILFSWTGEPTSGYEEHGDPRTGQIGATHWDGFTVPGALAWGPIGAGAVLVLVGLLLPRRPPFVRRPRGA